MEHRCYKCDAAVEDGVAFCSVCRAPQIRVMAVETSPAGVSVPELPAAQTGFPPLQRRSGVEWAQALPAAFLGLLIATLLSSLLRGALGIGLLTAGFLSVYFFRRRNPFTRLTLRLGARLGALSGVLGFGITAVATAVATAILHSGAEIHALMLKAIQQSVTGSSNPQTQQVLEFSSTREGFILMLALGSIMMFLLFLTLSCMGGMLGAAVLKKKDSI